MATKKADEQEEMIATCLKCKLPDCAHDVPNKYGCEYRQKYQTKHWQLRIPKTMIIHFCGLPEIPEEYY